MRSICFCVPGIDIPRWRKHASGAAPVVVGGAASNFVLGSVGGKHHAPETVCPDSKLKMGNYGFAISQGDGRDHNSTSGVMANKRAHSKSNTQEEAERKRQRKRQSGAPTPGAGGGIVRHS